MIMRIKAIIPFLTFLLLSLSLEAQEGCTDPRALNFDIQATINDGSCEYEVTQYALNQITLLPDLLRETSGLIFTNDNLWTLNDSGNENKLYRIDSLTGEVQFSVSVSASENVDWEDMAQSPTHIFVGDFGNNEGNRQDLKIYKIPKTDLGQVAALSEVISFDWPDQTDFEANPLNHNFDCEAFFFYNDSLHLFSKNWADRQTKHYVLPAEAGTYTAIQKETFNAEGLVTAADRSEDGVVILLGYTQSALNFMWLLFDYEGTNFFSGNKRRIELGSFVVNSQTEAIAFRENGYGYVTGEVENIFDQKLMSFRTSQWTDPIMVSNSNTFTPSPKLYPNPVEQILNIDLSEFRFQSEIQINLIDALGKKVLSKTIFYNGNIIQLDLSNYSKGIYSLMIKSSEEVALQKIIKQ